MRRGFEKVSGYEYVNFPKRKTKQSAGYDIESAVNVVINPGETKLIPTGIKVYMDENEWLGIYIRSSLAIKYGLILANSRYYKVDDDSADGDRTGGIGSTGK